MRYYSTANRNYNVSLKDAVLMGLPPDNGLFMPESIPLLKKGITKGEQPLSLSEIAFEISSLFLKGDLPLNVIHDVVNGSITFDAPLVRITDNRYVLELFHGPTLAFKDF